MNTEQEPRLEPREPRAYPTHPPRPAGAVRRVYTIVPCTESERPAAPASERPEFRERKLQDPAAHPVIRPRR